MFSAVNGSRCETRRIRLQKVEEYKSQIETCGDITSLKSKPISRRLPEKQHYADCFRQQLRQTRWLARLLSDMEQAATYLPRRRSGGLPTLGSHLSKLFGSVSPAKVYRLNVTMIMANAYLAHHCMEELKATFTNSPW